MNRERLLHHPLSAGWVALEREETEDGGILHFLAEMEFDEPVPAIFEQLVLGFSDSSRSWLWPTEYESCPALPPGGVREGALVSMTYRVPRFDRLETPAVPVTYVYRLARFCPDEHLIEYQTHEHPLVGGATISVHEIDASRCRISWIGHYRGSDAQEVVVNSMLKFLPLVFQTIDQHAQARRTAQPH